MKKQLVYVMVMAAVLGTGAVAHAQTAPATTKVVPKTATTSVAEAKAAKKARLQEAVTKMERSLEARVGNLDSLAARIQTRIGKIQAEGKDMTAASAKLVEAQKKIAEAKAELAKLKTANATMVASAKPATAFANIKNRSAKTVVVKIKEAHKALVDTITIMKGQGMTSSTSTAR